MESKDPLLFSLLICYNGAMKWIVGACILLFIFVWLAFYPPTFAIVDEAIYFGMSFVLRSGHLFPSPTEVADLYPRVQGRLVSLFPLGNSAVLVPFTFLGWRGTFLFPLLAHLLSTWLFMKLLKRQGLPLWGALLLLFYPVNVLYSRTLMSDLPSETLFLGALLFYQPKPKGLFFSGFCFGLLALFRVANLFLFLPYLLWAVLRSFRQRPFGPEALLLMAGFLPPFLGLLTLNQVSVGHPFGFAYFYAFPSLSLLALKTLPSNVLACLLFLLVLYPFMLLAPLWARRTRQPVSLLAMAGFILFVSISSYPYRHRSLDSLAYLLTQLRFVLPIIPLFLLSYVDFLENLFQRWNFRLKILALIFMIVGLGIGNVLLLDRHQKFLFPQEIKRRMIYQNTTAGSTLAYDRSFVKLIQSAWGKRTFLVVPQGDLARIVREAPQRNPLFYLQDARQPVPDDSLKPTVILTTPELRLLRIR